MRMRTKRRKKQALNWVVIFLRHYRVYKRGKIWCRELRPGREHLLYL